MTTKPLVSVFLPYYNDEKFLKDAIDSILNQTYENFELFLFNHASTDNSRNIAHSYNDERIKHIDAEKNLGAGSGYNLKITLPYMSGKYIKTFCPDDILYPNFIQSMVEYMEANPDIDIAFSNMKYINTKGKDIGTNWFFQHKDNLKSFDEKYILKNLLMRVSPLPFPANFIKRTALDNKAIIDSTTIMLFDVILWCSIMLNGGKLGIINEELVKYRISEKQISSYKNELQCYQRSFFESAYAYDIFYDVKDFELLKYLCSEVEYINMINENDTDLFPFIVAHYYVQSLYDCSILQSCHTALQINGYKKICDYLNNPILAKKLNDKFGFGIKEFRTLYSQLNSNDEKYNKSKNILKKVKKYIYSTNSKDLSIFQLIYLIMRKVWNIMCPTYYIHKYREYKQKTKGNYTV